MTSDLAQMLIELGQSIEPAVGFAEGVMARVDSQPVDDQLSAGVVRERGRRRTAPVRRPRRRRAVLAVFAGAIAVTIGLPGPRAAIARWLGFNDAIRIRPAPTEPTRVTTSAPPPTAPVASAPAASEPSATTSIPPASALTIDDAEAATGLVVPDVGALGDVVSVDVLRPPKSGAIEISFAPSDRIPRSPVAGLGAVLTVLPSELVDGFLSKTLSADNVVRETSVGGGKAVWIEGSPHEIGFVEEEAFVVLPTRLATNTLIWEADGVTYRLEAKVDQRTAEDLARSLGT